MECKLEIGVIRKALNAICNKMFPVRSKVWSKQLEVEV